MSICTMCSISGLSSKCGKTIEANVGYSALRTTLWRASSIDTRRWPLSKRSKSEPRSDWKWLQRKRRRYALGATVDRITDGFDFLGFEFRWEASRKGRPIVKRRTSRKKLQASVRRFGEWIKANRHKK